MKKHTLYWRNPSLSVIKSLKMSSVFSERLTSARLKDLAALLLRVEYQTPSRKIVEPLLDLVSKWDFDCIHKYIYMCIIILLWYKSIQTKIVDDNLILMRCVNNRILKSKCMEWTSDLFSFCFAGSNEWNTFWMKI